MLTREEKSPVRFHPAGTRGRDHQVKNRSQARFGGGFSLRGKRGFWWEKVPSIQKLYKRNFSRFAIHNCKIFWGKAWKTTLYTTFFELFSRNFQCLKACIQNALFFHCPKCFTKKVQKNLKKGVDNNGTWWYYIQVVAIRQQNKSQNRKTWTLKTEHKPRKKRMCGSSVL